MSASNRCFRLRSRPKGRVEATDLELVEESVPPIGDGQALIRTLWLSIDPTNRVWMSAMRSYIDPVPLDGVMRGIGIGEVVESNRDDMKPGDLVTGLTGWQDYAVCDDATNEMPYTVLPSPLPAPITTLLGVLGHTGITAYLGIEDIGKLQAGETMVVSAAAGAVGSVAGQIGKARGARVVGLAGTPEKCEHVVDDLGFDACINYKDGDWRHQLDTATPDGIDVDFENVGGEIMDHILGRMNYGGRVILSGMISQYNEGAETSGQKNVVQFIMFRGTLKGFVVLDHADRFPEAIGYLAGLLAEGKLKYDETIVDGLENARDAVNQMFDGGNTGKLLIKVAEPTVGAGGSSAQEAAPASA